MKTDSHTTTLGLAAMTALFSCTMDRVQPRPTTVRRALLLSMAALTLMTTAVAAAQLRPGPLLLVPDRVFDGERSHEGWAVLVESERIVQAGPAEEIVTTADARVVRLANATLLPGLIEGHSHLLLHPYNETPCTDQVLRESLAERTARAVVHARKTLLAGDADAGLKEAIAKGVVPGPRMLVATKAIVTTGSYNPRGAPEIRFHKGAEIADGHDELIRVVRDQIGRGADWIKVYADYRWGPDGTAQPTFTQRELQLVVEVAESSGRRVVAHAATAEGMRRATLAGVRTIEHGDGGDAETFAILAANDVTLCPTIAAGDAILQYGGWRKGQDPEPERVRSKRDSFAAAMAAGVSICFGGDVGVYPHGDNVRELELMVDYGMTPRAALRAATAGNAAVFELDEHLGSIRAGMLADLVAVLGDPTRNISTLREVMLVIKGGSVITEP